MTFDGTAAWQRPSWRVAGRGEINALDVRRWMGRTDMPTTSLNGTMQGSMAGTRDSSGTIMVNTAKGDLALQQREAEERPGFDVVASARLDPQRLYVDSTTVHVGGITLDAHGALARRAPDVAIVGPATDTLEVSARADTLDSVRRQLPASRRRLRRWTAPSPRRCDRLPPTR